MFAADTATLCAMQSARRVLLSGTISLAYHPMRASRVTLVVLAITLAVGGGASSAQNSPVTLSLARPDWVSADAFSSLDAIRVLSNGTVLVADAQEVEVHLLDATGKTVRQVGRKGSGPSEYTSPRALIALPHDSTFLLDRDARRHLIIDPRGQITKTEPFPTELGEFAESVVGADGAGRLLFGLKLTTRPDAAGAEQPIGRWPRGTNTFQTVAMFTAEHPATHPATIPIAGTFVAAASEVFGAANDWVTGTSGRIAVINATPYRVDWIQPDGKKTLGAPVTVTRVAVTDLDRKEREPAGPPYKRTYAKIKSPFSVGTGIVDDGDNVWVARSEPAGAKTRRWDVFGATGKLRSTVVVPITRRLLAITAKHAYVRYIDSDGLQWLERYAR